MTRAEACHGAKPSGIKTFSTQKSIRRPCGVNYNLLAEVVINSRFKSALGIQSECHARPEIESSRLRGTGLRHSISHTDCTNLLTRCRVSTWKCTEIAGFPTLASGSRRSSPASGNLLPQPEGRQLARLGNPDTLRSRTWEGFTTELGGIARLFCRTRETDAEIHSGGTRSITRTPGGATKTKREGAGLRLVRMSCNASRVLLPSRSTSTVSTISPVSRFARNSSRS